MGIMRYKPSDRVRIKSLDWYNKNKDNYGAIYAGNGFCFWKNMVRHCGEIMKITSVKVDPEDSNKGFYFMENSEERWTDEMIECKVEDEMSLDKAGQITDFEYDGLAYTPPEGYQFVDENGNVINATKIVLKKKEYPKTLEECCEVLDTGGYQIDYFVKPGEVYEYEKALITKISVLYNLIICRDAYWKIAGEEMGLDGPWEPDYKNENQKKCCIFNRGDIVKGVLYSANSILAFPIEEMRDAFYENFKFEIENCKELL